MTTYTISQWQAAVLASTWVPGSTIEDTAFDISAAGVLDSLQAAHTTIGEIIVSDNQPIGVDVAQITSDANALDLLHNANSSGNSNTYTLAVTDIGSNISFTALDALNDNTHVTSIVVSSGVVDVTAAQIASDSNALSILKTTLDTQASVTVDDTGAHIHTGWANIAADSQVSSIVISDNTQINLTAAQASQTTAVGELVQADSNTSDIVLVRDTAAHIEADLTALNSVASSIDTVTVSNNTFETLSATTVAADLSILSKVVFSSGPASFNVSDTATAISGNIDALESLSGSISSITVTTNSPITVSIEQLANDSDALSIMTYDGNPITVAVLDTGNNISGNLATLEAAIQAASPAITSISVSGSEAIDVQISQFTTDAGVFAALMGSYTLDVSDTAGNISGALSMLETLAANGNISAINVTDSGAIAVNVAQITSDASALAELVNRDTYPYTLAVTDSALDVAAGLVGLSGNSHVATIALTDATPVLTITQTQFFNGLTALGEITNGSFAIDVTGVGASQAANVASDFTGLSNAGDATLSIAVSDAATAISNYLGSLGTNSYVATISINNATALTLSETQYTNANYDAGLAKLTGSYTVDVTGVSVANLSAVEAVSGLGGTATVSIAVSDTGSAISGDLSSLGSDSKVTSIAVSSGVLSLTESQFTSDTAGLAKLTGSYTVDVTGVSYAQVPTVEAVSLPGTPTLSIAVSDTGGDLTSAALVALGGDSKVTSIAVSSGVLSLTESQFTSDTAGLAKLTGAYTVDVTGVSYLQVSAVEGISLPGTPTLSIAVSDTGGDLTSAALVALGGDSNVTSIAVSSGAISLTESQFVGDTAGLGKLTGSYTVDVTGVSYAQLPTVEGISLPGTPTLSIAVSDTGGDLTSAVLVALGGDSKVTSIAVSSGAISLTESQFTASGDDLGLAKLTGSYTVDVTGVSYAQVPTVEAISLPGTPTLSIAVSDTGGDLTSAALVALGGDPNVTSIAVTTGAISLTESQFTGDTAGLAKLTGPYTVDVTGVSYLQVSTVEAVSLPGTPTLSIAVSDTGGHLTSAALVALGGDSKVTSIAVSSGAISLTESQFTGDTAGLAKLTGSYTVDVTGVSYAQVSTVEAVSLPGTPTLSIAVSDTGGDLTAPALVNLGANSKVTSIAVTSGVISLTATQFTTAGEDAGLAKMTGTYTVDVMSVGVAKVAAVEAVSLPGTPTLSIAVSDIGSRFTSAELVTLGPSAKVTSITVTSGAISLTEAQFTASGDDLGLAKLTGSYTVDVTGVSYAQLPTVEGISLPGTPTLSIAVSDTGGDLTSAVLVALGGDSKVTSIAVSSGAISLTEAQFVASGDGLGLAKLTGAYTVDVTGVSYLQVSTVEGISLPGTPTLSIAVSDTGGDLTSAALVALGGDSKVTSIAVSSGAISLTESQFVGDTAGLDKLTGSYTVDVTGVSYLQVSTVEGISLPGTPTLSIAVSDTGGDLTSAALVALGGDSKVTSIAVSSGAISLTESQFTALGDDAGLAKLTGAYTVDVTGVSYLQVSTVEGISLPGTPTLSIAVSDTGGDLTSAALVALGGDSKVTSIAVSSGAISLTEAQFTGDTAGLAKLTGAYTVDVTGVSYLQVSTVEGISLPGTPTLSIAVSDSGTNITSAALVSLGSDSKVTSIAVSDSNPITLTEAQFVPDSGGLAKMVGAYTLDVTGATVAQLSTVESFNFQGTPTLSIAISDTGGDLTSAVLVDLGGDSKVTSIAVTSGAISLTEAQFTGDTAGLAKLTGSYTVDVTGVSYAQLSTVEGISLPGTPTLSIAISDTGGDLTSAAFVALGGDSKVTSIAVTSGAISLTEAQFTGDTAGLAKLTGSYTVDVTGVTYAEVATVDAVSLPGTPTLSIAVADTGGDLTAAALVSLGANSKVTSIAVTSGAISLTTSQFTASGEHAGLAKMTGSYTVDVMGVGVAMVATVEAVSGLGGTPTLSIAVADIGSRFTSAELVTLGADPKVTSISVTSGVVSLTEAAFTRATDDAGLHKFIGSYTVDVTGVTVAEVATVEAVSGLGGTPTLSIAVSDIAANLTSAALVALGGDNNVTSIAVSSGAISLTEAQFTGAGDNVGLGKLTGAYTVDVTGVLVAQLVTVEGISLPGTPTLSIAVSDRGSDLTSAALVDLGGDPKVTSITVTTGAISLTEAQFVADTAGLGKLIGSYTVDVTGVSYLQVSTVEGISLPGTPTLSIAVSDTGGDLTSSALAALGGDPKVTSITVTTGAISLTEAQFAADTAGLAKLTGTYTVDVTGVTVAEIPTVEGISLPGTPTLSIAVSDTGSAISGDLSALGSDSKVTSIAVSSGNLSLTEAAFTADTAGLAKLTGTYTVDVTGVTVVEISAVEGISLPGTPTLSIAVSDTGSAISGALSTLGSDSDVTSITVSSGNLSLTEAAFTTDTAGLGKMAGSYTVNVTGVTVAEIPTVEGVSLSGTPTLSIAVSDTGSAVSGDLSSLGSDSNVTSIALSSGILSLTGSEYSNSNDLTALSKMTGSYTVDVSSATVAEVSSVESATYGGTPTLSIAVSDVGSAFTGSALVSLGSDGDVMSIVDTSGAITLTEAQFTNANDDAGLAKMTGSYTVDVTGVTVGKVATVEAVTGLGGTPTLSIAVSDGGSVISGDLSTLGSDSDVTSITVSSGNLSLTEAAFTTDTAGLGKMAGSYTVNVTGVTVAEIPTVEGVSLSGTPTLSIAVSDTGSAVSGDLSSLGSDSNVTSIALSSGILSLTGSEYSNSNDLTALSKMTGSYTVDVSSATVAEVSSVESATYGGTPTLSIAVSDVGSAFTGSALVSLGSDGDVMSIAVTSGQISLTETQFTTTADQAGILKIGGSFAVNVTGVTAGQAATVTADFQNLSNSDDGTLSISVSDTAAHVATNAPALNTNLDVTTVSVTDTAAHVVTYLDTLDGVEALSTITLSDATPVLTMSEANFAGGLLALGAIQNASFAIDVTGALALQAATVASDFQGITFVGTPTLSIAVADNASDVAGDEAALNANSYITSVAVTDTAANVVAYLDTLNDVTAPTTIRIEGATPTLSLTAAQFEGGTTALGDVSNSTFTIDVTSATAAQAATIATEFGGLGNEAHATLSIAVSDTALDISNAMTVLEANAYVTSLTVSDSAALNITYTQFNAGTALLSELTGTETVNVTGVTGQAYGSFTDTYISGTLAETVDNNTNGSTSVIGYANNLTIAAVGPSSHVESITTTGAHGDTFVFTGSFGNDSVTGFNVANDSIEFSHTEFANVAAVEQHTTQVNGNAVVTLDSGDTITFVGVSMNSFEAHATDWSFI